MDFIGYTHYTNREEIKNLTSDRPIQVAFRDEISEDEANDWTGGILFNNVIICGCCGAIIELEDCVEVAIFQNWADVEATIRGGEFE